MVDNFERVFAPTLTLPRYAEEGMNPIPLESHGSFLVPSLA